MKCAACGSAVLVEGTLLDGGGSPPHFKPAAVSILKGMSDARAFLTSLLDP